VKKFLEGGSQEKYFAGGLDFFSLSEPVQLSRICSRLPLRVLLVPSQKHKESDWTVSVEVGISRDYYWAVRDTEI